MREKRFNNLKKMSCTPANMHSATLQLTKHIHHWRRCMKRLDNFENTCKKRIARRKTVAMQAR